MTENKRIVKFRAWDGKTKQMVPDYAFGPNSWDGGMTVARYSFELSDMVGAQLELMQFAGLLDKNGKEIYEGDIIQSKPYIGEGLIIGEVYFDQKSCIWKVKEITDRIPDIEYLCEVLKGAHESEVIGNIYENKNLLEHGK